MEISNIADACNGILAHLCYIDRMAFLRAFPGLFKYVNNASSLINIGEIIYSAIKRSFTSGQGIVDILRLFPRHYYITGSFPLAYALSLRDGSKEAMPWTPSDLDILCRSKESYKLLARLLYGLGTFKGVDPDHKRWNDYNINSHICSFKLTDAKTKMVINGLYYYSSRDTSIGIFEAIGKTFDIDVCKNILVHYDKGWPRDRLCIYNIDAIFARQCTANSNIEMERAYIFGYKYNPASDKSRKRLERRVAKYRSRGFDIIVKPLPLSGMPRILEPNS